MTLILELSKNPVNPKFGHYIFESLVTVIRTLSAVPVEALQATEKFVFNGLVQGILVPDVAGLLNT